MHGALDLGGAQPDMFADGFLEFFEEGLFTDAVIVFANDEPAAAAGSGSGDEDPESPPQEPSREYHVHRLLLAHSSEFFARSFLSEFRESVDRRIVLHFRDPLNVFPEVLSFIYRGTIEVADHNAVPLNAMAEAFIMDALREITWDYIENNCNRHSVMVMIRHAVACQTEALYERCLSVVTKNFHFLAFEDMAFLPYPLYLSVVGDPNLAVSSEWSVYSSIAAYVDGNEGGLADDELQVLFELVRYPFLTFEQLEDVQENPHVPRNLLVQGMMSRLRRHEGGGSSRRGSPATSNSSASLDDEAARRAWLRNQPRPPYAIALEFNARTPGQSCGVFHWIATAGGVEEWRNPALLGRVAVSASSIEKGLVENIVSLEPTECWTKDVPASWFLVDLGPGRTVVPNFYTLRHGGNYKADLIRNWDLQGSRDGENWDILSRHVKDSALKGPFDQGSWPIYDCESEYRYFRLLQNGHNSSNHNYLVASGFEIYGEYYSQESAVFEAPGYMIT